MVFVAFFSVAFPMLGFLARRWKGQIEESVQAKYSKDGHVQDKGPVKSEPEDVCAELKYRENEETIKIHTSRIGQISGSRLYGTCMLYIEKLSARIV